MWLLRRCLCAVLLLLLLLSVCRCRLRLGRLLRGDGLLNHELILEQHLRMIGRRDRIAAAEQKLTEASKQMKTEQ